MPAEPAVEVDVFVHRDDRVGGGRVRPLRDPDLPAASVERGVDGFLDRLERHLPRRAVLRPGRVVHIDVPHGRESPQREQAQGHER